jgi:peptide/nickel transport system ATP-binding protein
VALLDVQDLQTHFRTAEGVNRAVDGVSFHVEEGETLAIVGESGCGKSVTANSILRLIPQPPGKIAGSIRFNGKDLLSLPERAMRDFRGKEISMIFQEPMTSLNPVFTVGRQITETLKLHDGLDNATAQKRAIDLLALVGIPDPQSRVHDYPHRLSGGMRQRVMIAMALACNPKLLIADEPTTALDVTIQAQILDLMRDLKTRLRAAIILITHDLGVVAEIAQRVMVMYAGRKVEEAPVNELFRTPRHPYTRGLLGAVPKLGSSLAGRAQSSRKSPASCRTSTNASRDASSQAAARRSPTFAARRRPHLKKRPRRMSPPATTRAEERYRCERASPRSERPEKAFHRRRHGRQDDNPRGRWHFAAHRARRDSRPRRRIRLWQIDRRARDPAPVRDHRRHDRTRWRAHRCHFLCAPAPPAAAAAGCVPGSVFEPQSAHARARHPRRADPQFPPRP